MKIYSYFGRIHSQNINNISVSMEIHRVQPLVTTYKTEMISSPSQIMLKLWSDCANIVFYCLNSEYRFKVKCSQVFIIIVIYTSISLCKPLWCHSNLCTCVCCASVQGDPDRFLPHSLLVSGFTTANFIPSGPFKMEL